MENKSTKLQKHKTKILVGIIVILLLVIFGLLMFRPSANLGLKEGSLTDDTETSDVAPTDFLCSMNTNIIVEDGVGNLRIENSVNNHDSCRVKLYTADETLLFESPEIPTGYYIESAELQEDLPVGSQEGYAIFEVLGTDDIVKSSLILDVDITVKN